MVSAETDINNKLNHFFKLSKKGIKTPPRKTEIVNETRLKYLLGNSSVVGNDRVLLEKYDKKVKYGKVEVTYVLNKDCDKDRIYPKGGAGLAPMNKIHRSFLAEEVYADADIENSHPRLLYSLCTFKGVSCPEVAKIVNHREEYLQGVINELGCSRGQAKEYVNASINGRGTFQDTESLGALYTEMRNLRFFVKSEYPEIYKGDVGELTAFNTILSFFELKLMMETHDELEKLHWEIDTLIHDGFLVRKNHKNNRVLEEDLERVSAIVRERTGLDFYDMRVKPFVEHGFIIDGDVESELTDSLITDLYVEFSGARGGSKIMYHHDNLYCCATNNLWKASTRKSFTEILKNPEFAHFIKDKTKLKFKFTNANSWDRLARYFELDARFHSTGDFEFNSNPELLPFTNGKVIVLQKNNKETPWFVRDLFQTDYYTLSCGYDFDDVVNPEGLAKAKAFFSDPFQDPDTAETYLTILGSSLSGELHYKNIFFNKGHGDNGKSVQTKGINSVYGDFGCTFNPSYFAETPNQDHSIKNPEGIINKDKRIGGVSEPKAKLTLDAEKMKQYTGDDDIKARFLNDNDVVDFTNKATIFASLNSMMYMNSLGVAEKNRIRVIPFDSVYKVKPNKPYHRLADPTIKSYIKSHGFRIHALHVLLEYWGKFVRADCILSFSDHIMQTTKELITDDLDTFLELNLVPGDFVPLCELYEHYASYYNGPNEYRIKSKNFKDRIAVKGYRVEKVDRKRNLTGKRCQKDCIIGFVLKDPSNVIRGDESEIDED
jgi:hypothetical protein